MPALAPVQILVPLDGVLRSAVGQPASADISAVEARKLHTMAIASPGDRCSIEQEQGGCVLERTVVGVDRVKACEAKLCIRQQ